LVFPGWSLRNLIQVLELPHKKGDFDHEKAKRGKWKDEEIKKEVLQYCFQDCYILK
jgi:hypothetical protein